MKIIDGWLTSARQIPSPNYNERPAGEVVDLLVIHNISLPPGQFGTGCVERFFQNCLPVDEHPYFVSIAGLQVSSHFLISREGNITQFVSCDSRAWHAGQSTYCGRENCNDFSIGIELEGTDECAYEAAQYQALAELTQAIQEAYPAVMTNRITGHQNIAPGRKTDPGESFDWDLYFHKLNEL